MRSLPLGLAAPILLAGCVSHAPLPPAAPQPHFDPIAFFSSHSTGTATLRVAFGKPKPVRVDSVGRPDGNGGVVLDQHITGDSKHPRDRRWVIRAIGPDRFAGTLTDADGPVSGDVHGNRLHLAYPMKGSMEVEQWLTLQPGGEVADNVMTVRKFGVPVAALHETIRRETAH